MTFGIRSHWLHDYASIRYQWYPPQDQSGVAALWISSLGGTVELRVDRTALDLSTVLSAEKAGAVERFKSELPPGLHGDLHSRPRVEHYNGGALISINIDGKYPSPMKFAPVHISEVAPGRRSEHWALIVPAWLIGLLAAVVPSAWLFRVLRDRRRQSMGCCRGCGYDLRATPDRCPECGAIPSAAKGATT